jgi:hypothetical protein
MDLVCEVCSLAGTQLHTKLSMALADDTRKKKKKKNAQSGRSKSPQKFILRQNCFIKIVQVLLP